MAESENTKNVVLSWVNKKDCAIITASRAQLKNITPRTYKSDKKENDFFSEEENRFRNIELLRILRGFSYAVIKIHRNNFLKTDILQQENSFLVINVKNDLNFSKNIFLLGEYFNQDCVFIKEKNIKKAYSITTNNYTALGTKSDVGEFINFFSTENMEYANNFSLVFLNKNNPDDEFVKINLSATTSFLARKNMRIKALATKKNNSLKYDIQEARIGHYYKQNFLMRESKLDKAIKEKNYALLEEIYKNDIPKKFEFRV